MGWPVILADTLTEDGRVRSEVAARPLMDKRWKTFGGEAAKISGNLLRRDMDAFRTSGAAVASGKVSRPGVRGGVRDHRRNAENLLFTTG